MKVPKIPKSPPMAFIANRWKINPLILAEAKRRNQIVYGSQAITVQLPPMIGRKPQDWDIFTRNPKATAHRMQRKFDKEVAEGKDDFYAKPAKHKGTYRVLHEGFDGKQRTKDDIAIVDYTKMPLNLPTVSIGGVRYERISSVRKRKKQTLKDKKSRYRHAKDRSDLSRISIGQGIRSLFGASTSKKRKRKRKKR